MALAWCSVSPLLICKRTTFSMHCICGILMTKTFLPECSLLENQGSVPIYVHLWNPLNTHPGRFDRPFMGCPQSPTLKEFHFYVLCHNLSSLLDSEPTQQGFCNSHICAHPQFPAECLVKGRHICRRHNGHNLNTLS